MTIPSFRGLHNASKSKVWLLLAQEADNDRYFTAKEIHSITGVPYRSLLTLLARWHSWRPRPLQRRQCSGFYEYHISMRGLAWVERWRMIMPLARYYSECQTWQSENNPEIDGKSIDII